MAQNTKTFCPEVEKEFGAEPTPEALYDLNEFAAYLGEELRLSNGRNSDRPGESAARTIHNLGCAACALNVDNGCGVPRALQVQVEEGGRRTELLGRFSMLSTSPAWLTAARLNLSHTSPTELEALTTPDQLSEALKTGSFNLEEFLCGVTNKPGKIYSKKDLPEISGVPAIKDADPLPATEVTTRNGDQFVVIDATAAVGFSGQLPSESDYGVLTSKLLTRMSERDASGKPQIFTTDHKMQGLVARGRMSEIRMSGKSRLYFILTPSSQPKEPSTIVILGSHGGNASTQQQFIDLTMS